MTDQKTPKTAAERQEELIAQLVRLAGSVEGLAQRGAAPTTPTTGTPETPPLGVRRAQFSYVVLSDLLGRPAGLVRVTADRVDRDNRIFLTLGDLPGGTAVVLRSRDGNTRTFAFRPGQEFDTQVPVVLGIDIVVVLAADGAPLAVAACPSVTQID